MIFKDLCVLVLWTKVASALEGLMFVSGSGYAVRAYLGGPRRACRNNNGIDFPGEMQGNAGKGRGQLGELMTGLPGSTAGQQRIVDSRYSTQFP